MSQKAALAATFMALSITGLPYLTLLSRLPFTRNVNKNGSLIWSQRWMEPEDPTLDPDDKKTSKIAMQVDFRNYKAVSGVQWPFDIIHWYGGKVDYRITVTDVKVNQPLADVLFQKP